MSEQDKPTLEDMKTRISDKYLGQHGIHAVGCSRKHNAVTVYHDTSNTPEQKALLGKIEAEVKTAGFNLVARPEPPAQFAAVRRRPPSL